MNRRIVPATMFVFMIVWFLIGCQVTVTTTASMTSTTTVTTSSTTEVSSTSTTEMTPEIQPGPTYDIIDLATDFSFRVPVMKTYRSQTDPGTAYVDIKECIELFGNGITVIAHPETSRLELQVMATLEEEIQDDYGTPHFQFVMMFDALDDTVRVNDVSMFDYMNPGTNNTPYYTSLRLSRTDLSDVDRSMTMNLSRYGIDIVLQDNAYYIPLYLANLLLTGPSLEWIEYEQTILAFDDQRSISEVENVNVPDSPVDLALASQNTQRYLGLYFDYFYGLKKSQGVSSYRGIIESYDLTGQTDSEAYYRALERFLNDLDDLHTQLVSTAHRDPDFETTEAYPSGSRLERFQIAYDVNACDERTTDFVSRIYDDVQIIEINAFTLETKDELAKTSIHSALPVVIDVSCNTGGVLVGVIELLTYMTNDMIQIQTKHPLTGEVRVDWYSSATKRAIDANFIVLTSPVTFSAANLFVSIVKDMDLGLIVGEPSSGGACAIRFTTLPDGSILVSSSHFSLQNGEGLSIEQGIPVDFELDMPLDWETYSGRISSIYHLLAESESAIWQNGDRIVIQQTLAYKASALTNVTYRLTISAYDTILLDQSFTNSFEMEYRMMLHDRQYQALLEVTYRYNGLWYTERLAFEVFDDYGSYYEENLMELCLDEPLIGGKAWSTDQDSFRIVVEEAGLYRFYLNDSPTTNAVLFDQELNQIGRGPELRLMPGTYILSVHYPAFGDHRIWWTKVVENTSQTEDPYNLPMISCHDFLVRKDPIDAILFLR